MREEIARLMNLQAIDRQLQELRQSLSSIAGRVDALRDEMEKAQAELDRLSAEETQSVVARKRQERELAEGEAHIRNKRMRLNMVRNEKELQALNHEVEALKESNQRLEGELLAAMASAEPRGPRIKELTALIAAKTIELRAAEKEIASDVERIKTSISHQHAERDHLASKINQSLLQRYEVIFSRRGGVAVTLARQYTCQGCRMRLPPQLYNEIQKQATGAPVSEQVHFCPNCQRILFFETETPAAK